MNKEQLIELLKEFFTRHEHMWPVSMAFLYGSWAHDMQRNDSDIDIAVMFKENNPNEIFDYINAISLSLSDHLHRDVNILYIDDDISKPMLHYNAIVKGEVLYFDDFTHYVDVLLKALEQMEDFSMFGLSWQKQIAEKNLKDLTNA
ncbi:MAG: nucleotidyltransferase domain-containing protein [Spirochaetota bacterium]|nr:nucleotidyltransferase domain-containing protein [Spirochaetota bacterium]